MEIKLTDNSAAVLDEFQAKAMRALVMCGMAAHKYAVKMCPADTGNLRLHIAFRVDPDEHAAYVGSNSEYASYVEFGTGKYNAEGKGRPGWWVYVEGGSSGKKSNNMKIYTYEEAKRAVAYLKSKGLDAHMTQGRKAKPFIKPAVADHAQTYRSIIESELRNG